MAIAIAKVVETKRLASRSPNWVVSNL